jgi:hypothetical protein
VLVLLLRLLPLRLPGLHLTLVVLLQGQVGGMTDRQRLLQLSVLGGKRVMIGALVTDPPAWQHSVSAQCVTGRINPQASCRQPMQAQQTAWTGCAD